MTKCLFNGCEAYVDSWTNYCPVHAPFPRGKGVLRSRPHDDRDSPIEQSVISIDSGGGDCPPVGSPPRPPYDGPLGGGEASKKETPE